MLVLLVLFFFLHHSCFYQPNFHRPLKGIPSTEPQNMTEQASQAKGGDEDDDRPGEIRASSTGFKEEVDDDEDEQGEEDVLAKRQK
jgi:hypothetical protein